MKIKLHEITIGDLVKDYKDHINDGVVGYGGRLDIRPPYQREFVYKDKQRNAVIETVVQGFPLNVMYWAKQDDGDFEIIDGQQRTISICQYVEGRFSYLFKTFHNLEEDERRKFLDYRLHIYVCEGEPSEKLKWFKVINIAGETLTDQELRNAVYHGSWVGDAKRYFSKPGCQAHNIGGDYLNGSAIRQEYLETTIKWIAEGNIEDYMSLHQHDPNANELWLYFQKVIAWVKANFPKYRKAMKGIAWGELYNQYKDEKLDPAKLEKQIEKLWDDDDVTSESGIYYYLLTGEEKHLTIRAFDKRIKKAVYKRQHGKCPRCTGKDKIKLPMEEMEADHIKPWSKGGKTIETNCQLLCRKHNREKAAK